MSLVSVITLCSYGYGRYLRENLESVQAQTFRDFEQIVVLAGNRDDESAVAYEFQTNYPNVKILEILDLNISYSRNLAIAASSAPYICNIDADDKIAPTFLEKTLAIAAPKTLVCSGMYHGFAGEHGKGTPNPYFSLQDIQRGNQLFCCTVFPRQDFEEVGGYDVSLQNYEDWELWHRMLKHGCAVKIVPECLFYYRVYPCSLTANITVDQHLEACKAVWARVR